ncbi:MAG TPA: hypothetical protein VKJ65_11310 [Phycisphaerae bacterium]|nr:hypothetical protein [Phycisphaerae bacterium]
MILPLRQLHQRMVIVLGIVLPIAFALGIGERMPVPKVSGLPEGLAPTPVKFDAVEWTQNQFFPKEAIQARLLRERKDSGHYAIQFSVPKDFLEPDLLVYWDPSSQNVSQSLPENAILQGGFGTMALPLSDEATQASGVFVLYSLANNEIVDVSMPVNVSTPAK